MKFENVHIESLGYHLPENIVSSEELEKRIQPVYQKLKMSLGRLELMSGIKERRFWGKGVFPSQISSFAGERAIEKSGLDNNYR